MSLGGRHAGRLAAAALLCAVGCSSAKRSGARLFCSPPECTVPTELQLVAEVATPMGAALVDEEYVNIEPDKTGGFRLQLDAPVTIEGWVRLPSGPVAGTVLASRPSRIAGRGTVLSQATIDPSSGYYSLLVGRTRADESYTVRVVPDAASDLPPRQVTVKAASDQRLDIVYPSLASLPEVHGTVVNSLRQPIAGLRVQAVDAATDQLISTTAVTAPDGGYSIRLIDRLPATLRVSAAPFYSQDDDWPTLTVDVARESLTPSGSLALALQMPSLPAATQVIYPLVGNSTNGVDTPVPSATCVFTADLSDPLANPPTRAIHRVTATSDSQGQVTAFLFSGPTGSRTYALSIGPDLRSSFGATSTVVTVAPQGGVGQSIALPRRAELTGAVHDPQGHAIADLLVTTARSSVAESLGTSADIAVMSPPQAVCDYGGGFSVYLDHGTWDIGLIPPAKMMLPRLWRTTTEVLGDLNLGPIVLPRGVVVHSLVVDPDGQPLSNATVRLYTVAANNANCAAGDLSCLAPPRLRAEGTSGDDGQAALILPSQPD